MRQSIHLLCALLLLIASLDSGHALRVPANLIGGSRCSTAPTTASVAEAPTTTENDLLPTAASDELLASLRKRRADIADGAGKRYRVASQVRIAAHTAFHTACRLFPTRAATLCAVLSLERTQVGFLNVHTEPGDPFRTDNVVRQLPHGAVVESKVEQGVWVDHDGGGWSIRVYDGHEYLVPVD